LLGSELLIVDAAFFLVFIGAAAILTGVLASTQLFPELWMEWLLFSAISLIAMVFFRKRLYQKLRGSSADYEDGLGGQVLRLETSLNPGDSVRQSFRGTDWTVVNRGQQRLEAETDVRITRTDGTTIIVTESGID
jgi:membrane protein implicated in regulation of membrane protease activity